VNLLSISEASNAKPASRAGLFVFCVIAFLLAWWPWSVWIVFGAAYAHALKNGEAGSLLPARFRHWHVKAAERITHPL
jgi:hypothetical protein